LGKERKKIDNKSLEGILVGFDEEKKGYRVYVPFEKRIIVSAHVKIDENTTRMLT
jgi:formylmethanofuran dehydrogenase subunit E-like metal-binding protein